MAERLTTRQLMFSLTAVLPVRVIRNVQLDELLAWMATVNELVAHAACPTMSAAIVSTAARTLFSFLVIVFILSFFHSFIL